jgi:hypothetical protein
MGKVSINGRVNVNTIRGITKWSQARYDELYKEHITDNPWVRPSDWIDVPTPTGQTIYLIYGCQSGLTNDAYLRVQGDYNVDWGDGTSSGYTSNETAIHSYNYDTCGGTDTTIGRQVLITITPNGGNITNFNLDDPNDSKFFQELKINAIHLINIEGYFNNSDSDLRNVEIYDNALVTIDRIFNRQFKLERFYLEKSNSTMTQGITNPFYMCYNLKYVEMPSDIFENSTSINGLFISCRSLKMTPYFDFSNCITLMSIYNGCENLLYVPRVDSSNATTLYGFYNDCFNLEAIPEMDTSECLVFRDFFTNCKKLSYIPWFNTSKGTNFNGCFEGLNIHTIPNIDISNATSLQNFLAYSTINIVPDLSFPTTTTDCYMIFIGSKIGEFPSGKTLYSSNCAYAFSYATRFLDGNAPDVENTGLSTIFSAMFYGTGIQKPPKLNLSGVTISNASSMFRNARVLQELPEGFQTNGLTNWTQLFDGSNMLREIPSLDASSGTTFTYTFRNCYSLKRCGIYGILITHDYTNCAMNAENLNRVFTNLGSGVSSQTITVTGNPGVSEPGYDPSIATAKGWTVVDS